MAFQAVQFPTLSFAQNNPYLTGLQANTDLMGSRLKNQFQNLQNQAAQAQLPYQGGIAQQELLKSQLGNQVTQAGLPSVGPQAAANVGLTQAQIPAEQAQAALTGQQANTYGLQFMDPISKMYYARMALLPKLMSQNGGMTVAPAQQNGAQNPNASQSDLANTVSQSGIPLNPNLSQATNSPVSNFNYPVLPGASGMQPQQSPQLAGGPMGTGNAAMPQLPGMSGMPDMNTLYGMQTRNMLMNMGKNPAFGSMRGGAGGTYYDPTSGQVISTPTSQNTTLAQRNVTSLQRVKPLLQQLSDNLAQFQTAKGYGALKAQQLSNFVAGTNYNLPNQYAQGQSALQTAPESLIRAWGLNVTNDALDMMRKAVEPQFGESEKGYQSRIVDTLGELQKMQTQSEQQLSTGIPLGMSQGAAQQQPQPQSTALKTIGNNRYVKINGQWYQQ